MPFKTRKQKLKALQRRFSISATLPVNYQSLTPSEKRNLSEKTSEISSLSTPKQVVGSIESDYKYVKIDLLRVAVLAGAIVIFQILILLSKNRFSWA